MQILNTDTKFVSKFIKDAVDHLRKTDGACCFNYCLPGGEYVLAVGWSGGYDKDDEDCIHSRSNPTYCISAGIKVRNDGDCADYAFLDMPWFENGEVYDSELTILKDVNYQGIASYLIDNYKKIQKLRNKGKLFNSSREYWDEEGKCWYAK